MLRGIFGHMYASAASGTLNRTMFRNVCLLDEGVCPSCFVALRRSRLDDSRFKQRQKAWVCTACGQIYGLYLRDVGPMA